MVRCSVDVTQCEIMEEPNLNQDKQTLTDILDAYIVDCGLAEGWKRSPDI